MNGSTLRVGSPGGGRRLQTGTARTHRDRPSNSASTVDATVSGTVLAALAIFGLLVAANYAQTALLVAGVAIGAFVLARTLRSGLPMPGTGARLRVFTEESNRTEQQKSWSLTVSLQEKRSN